MLLIKVSRGKGKDMNKIKSFQGYVNQSLMDAGKHKDKDYLKIMTGLFKEGHLNFEQVFMFMRTLVRNSDKDTVINYLGVNDDISSQVQDTVDYGFITEGGDYTKLCVDKMIEMGFEETQGESVPRK
tara:strand:+ start:1136 stop:1516 length:381 start_codon:yes stop_codon:yes gene_type:complete